MNDRDIDAEFDAIVAHWDDEDIAPPRPRTVQDITTAYAALSRPEVDAPPPPDEPPDDAAIDDRGREDGAPEDAAPAPADPALADAAAAAPEAAVTGSPATGRSTEHVVGPEAWRQGPSIDDEDDHFEPPPVQLPPGEDIGYWGALIGLVGGPLVLLWVILSKPFYASWWTLGAILMFFGGFALLVMRQPKDRDPFDGDDGARV